MPNWNPSANRPQRAQVASGTQDLLHSHKELEGETQATSPPHSMPVSPQSDIPQPFPLDPFTAHPVSRSQPATEPEADGHRSAQAAGVQTEARNGQKARERAMKDHNMTSVVHAHFLTY